MQSLQGLTKQIASWIAHQDPEKGVYPTPLDGLLVLSYDNPYPITAVVYEPLICLILQGEKETRSGSRGVLFGPGESLVVSHHLPVMARVTKATAQEPYIAIVLTLDLLMLRSLEAELGDVMEERHPASALQVGRTSPALVDAIGRLFNLVDQPREIAVMAPLIRREIHFRLLREGQSKTIRQLLQRGSHADRIARAISRIKQDFATSLMVPDLAKEVGMSPSLFYSQFKALTATTPLQYQKNLRLIEARRMLSEVGDTVSGTAYRVGYESPTQFSREYSRKYGESPAKTRASSVQHESAV